MNSASFKVFLNEFFEKKSALKANDERESDSVNVDQLLCLSLTKQNQIGGPVTRDLTPDAAADGVQTFVSLLRLPQVDLGDGFEVDVPQSDAAVPSSGGKSFLTGVHAEDPCLQIQNSQNTDYPSASLPLPGGGGGGGVVFLFEWRTWMKRFIWLPQ